MDPTLDVEISDDDKSSQGDASEDDFPIINEEELLKNEKKSPTIVEQLEGANRELSKLEGAILRVSKSHDAARSDPLTEAAIRNKHARCEELLRGGHDPNVRIKGDNYRGALSYAGEHGAVKTMKVLLRCGAKPDLLDGRGETALFHAVAHVDTNKTAEEALEVTRLLLRAGASATHRQLEGETVIMRAARYTYPGEDGVAIFRLLVKYGASAVERNRNGCTVLHQGGYGKCQLGCAEFLIKNGAKVNAKSRDGFTPLHQAAAIGENVALVQLYLRHKADPNAETGEGLTPLHLALRSRDEDSAKALLDAGAKPTRFFRRSSRYGNSTDGTPLHIAAAESSPELAQLLLKKGGSEVINRRRTSDGLSALMVAARSGNDDRLEVFARARGVEVNQLTAKEGISALSLACFSGYTPSALTLIDVGAHVNICDMFGFRPLHYAAFSGHVAVVQALLEHGADKDSQCKLGLTPLDMAGPHIEVVEAWHSLNKQKKTLFWEMKAHNPLIAESESYADTAFLKYILPKGLILSQQANVRMALTEFPSKPKSEEVDGELAGSAGPEQRKKKDPKRLAQVAHMWMRMTPPLFSFVGGPCVGSKETMVEIYTKLLNRFLRIGSGKSSRTASIASASSSSSDVLNDTDSTVRPDKVCGACGRRDGPLKRCSRCWSASYCSRDCQRAAFKTHKLVCVPPSDKPE